MTIPNTAAPQSGQAAKLAYSVPEAAKALGVGVSTLRRSIKRGEVPTARVGSRVLIPADALKAFLQTGVK